MYKDVNVKGHSSWSTTSISTMTRVDSENNNDNSHSNDGNNSLDEDSLESESAVSSKTERTTINKGAVELTEEEKLWRKVLPPAPAALNVVFGSIAMVSLPTLSGTAYPW